MKKAKPTPLDRPSPGVNLRPWLLLAGFVAAFLAVLEVYSPALGGPFVFDDIYLPFYAPGLAEAPLGAWLSGMRPLLMFSFWLNYRISGTDPYGYHLLNLLLHLGNGVLVFLLCRKTALWAGETRGRAEWLAGLGAALFLLHPLQTESVAYVASRSELLSVLLFHAAFALFVYRRRDAVSYPEAGGILALFAGAALTKEHTAVLPGLLLVTDWFAGAPPAGFDPRAPLAAIRRNWRLYVPIALGGAAGLAYVLRILRAADTAGFGLKEFTWYQYLFTQCRVIWLYVRLFFLPYGQNLDPDLAVSRTLFEHGAILGLAGLGAVTAAAWYWRRRYPLAAFGWLVFLLLLAPTSSVAPIRDVAAERRMYLPMIGLLLVVLDGARRIRLSRPLAAGGAALALLAFGSLTQARNRLWADPVALWQDTAAKSPNKARPHFQLAYAYYQAGRCADAVQHYATASRFEPPDYRLLVDHALALDCVGQYQQAVEMLRQAAGMEKTAHVYSLIGMLEAKRGNSMAATEALDTAESLDPRYEMTFVYRGNLLAAAGERAQAAAEYRKALALNPSNQAARDALRELEVRPASSR